MMLGRVKDPSLRQVFHMDILESGTRVFSHDSTMSNLLCRVSGL